ncbi:GNAT family N-acetyltransferase [Streptomyces sp. NBC_01476]|uniref:GNAT family N-acetyltransferase n=1 Tax=Streptomyces sp. NBC_01476 TaxID=2903881 RepID=UPI002E34CC28|nr:GNAT family protein [Streptomyces sp. NBC_01476]
MIRGEKIGLRARQESDVAVLHTELYEDVAMTSRADTRAWKPIAAGAAESPYAVGEPSEVFVPFSVADLETGELAGAAVLWGIDAHNRSAHLGLSLRPAFRGRGLGTDVVRTLCEYGFAVRGLRRLQVETLTDNQAMIGAAKAAGFQYEGTLRRASWVYGRELDEVVFGLLHDEWAPAVRP